MKTKSLKDASSAGENRYFEILQRIAEGYFEVDLAGRFTFFNDAVTRITGYPRPELARMDFRDYTTPETAGRLFRIFNQIFKTGKSRTVTCEIIRKGGSPIQVETSGGLLADASGQINGFYGLMRDRSEQIGITEALRQSEDSYLSFLSLAPDAVTIGRLEDGRYLYVNEAFCEKTGYRREEAIGRSPLELNLYVHPEDREKFIDQVQQHGWVKEWELAFRSKDGTIRTHLLAARPIRFQGQDCLLAMTMDITSLKEAQQALRRSEESLRITLNSIGDAVIATDTQGRVVRMNPVAETLTGWPAEGAVGRDLSKIFTIFDEKSGRPVEGLVARVLAEGKVVGFGGNTVLISRNKQQRPIADSAAPIRDINGKPAGVVLVFRDITERRASDNLLRESERKYRTILEIMEEGYFEIDMQGHITRFNEATRRLHGYPDEEFMGMSYKQFMDDATAQKYYEIFVEMYATGRPAPMLEYEVIRKDGSLRMCEMSAYPLKSSSGEMLGFWGITRDRTERKRAEIALKESEERMRSIFESAAVGIAYYNIQGEFIRVNHGFCDIVGYSANELLLLRAIELAHPDDRHVDDREIERLLHGEQKSFNTERRLIRKNGDVVWCKTSISLAYGDSEDPMYFVAVVEDITERKKAKEALEQSEERYRLLVDNANEGIYITCNGRIKYLNPKALEIMGADAAALADLPFVELVHPEDREVIYRRQQQRFEREQRPGVFSFRLLNLQNEILWVQLSTVGIVWQEAPAALNFLRDVTHQKKMESQLLQAQKLESVGTLAGGVAHDFNNLLMGIQGNVSLSLFDLDQQQPLFQRLKNIEQYVKAGADLTRQLLGTARGGKYEARPIDLNQVLDTSAEMFGRTKKEITIHKKFQEDLWIVEADRGQIEQVLLNLYVNAWQAMPEGGRLYLQSRNISLDQDDVKPHGVATGRYVRISVTDTGVGIESQHQKRIFDPFYTTKGMGRGTGLGLASAYGIITNHGGMITVYSERGSGATFNIYLPACHKAAETEKAEIEQAAVPGHETILLVDDEKGILEVGRLFLEKLGYRVVSASGGEEAVQHYAGARDRIDLVILDMIMPGMNGGETFDALKQINPAVRVLLSSGYSINTQAQQILERGCSGFIQKPFGLQELSLKLRQILDRS